MSRQVRRVPANWEHPKDERGHYIPMHEHFPYNEAEVSEGLRDGWLKDDPPNYGVPVMPQWSDEERTHWQMYEDVSEGTPISPPMPSAEELARWLYENKASAGAYATATYEQWLNMIHAGWAPSMVMVGGRIYSGVEALEL